MTKNQSTYLDGLLHGVQVGIIAATAYNAYSEGSLSWRIVAASVAVAVILLLIYRSKK